MAIPKGVKVVSRSNQYDDPLIIGTVKGDARNEVKCANFVPVIEQEDGTEVFSFGITVPYDELLHKRLQTMDGKRQWDYLAYFRTMVYPEANK